MKTEKELRESVRNIATTEYVRLIKHKSKVLFEFTQKGSSLTEGEKKQVKDLYKRLRTVLKEVDKWNQTKVAARTTAS